MIHILLLILKIIGIIIAILLGLVLLILGVVLFVPVRYRGSAEFYGKPKGSAVISWLLHAVSLSIDFDAKTGTSVHIVLKVLGRCIYDNQRKDGSGNKKSESKKAENEITENEVTENEVTENEIAEHGDTNKKSIVEEADQTSPEILDIPEESVESEIQDMPEESVEPEIQDIPEESVEPEILDVLKDKAEPSNPDAPVDDVIHEDVNPLIRFFEKIWLKLSDIGSKIRNIPNRIRGIFEGISEKKNRILSKLQGLRDKKDAILNILYDEKNKPSFDKVKKNSFALLRHIKPRKLKGNIYFGFEDPSSTGCVLGLLSMLYPIYEDKLMLYPDFEKQIFQGDLSFSGRIRVSVLLYLIVPLIFDKDIRRIINLFKNI